jgi:hypothetical protein
VCKIMGPLFFEETGSDIVIQGIERRIENVWWLTSLREMIVFDGKWVISSWASYQCVLRYIFRRCKACFELEGGTWHFKLVSEMDLQGPNGLNCQMMHVTYVSMHPWQLLCSGTW